MNAPTPTSEPPSLDMAGERSPKDGTSWRRRAAVLEDELEQQRQYRGVLIVQLRAVEEERDEARTRLGEFCRDMDIYKDACRRAGLLDANNALIEDEIERRAGGG